MSSMQNTRDSHKSTFVLVKECKRSFLKVSLRQIFCQTFRVGFRIHENCKLTIFRPIKHNKPGKFTIGSIVKHLHANRELQHLEIRLRVGVTIHRLMGMISGNKSISKLDLRDQITYENVNELNHFIDAHQQMKELIFTNTEFDEDGGMSLTPRSNSLKRFEFKIKNQGQDKFAHFSRKH